MRGNQNLLPHHEFDQSARVRDNPRLPTHTCLGFRYASKQLTRHEILTVYGWKPEKIIRKSKRKELKMKKKKHQRHSFFLTVKSMSVWNTDIKNTDF